MAKATDRRRQDVKRTLVLPEYELGYPAGSSRLVNCETSSSATVLSRTGGLSTNQGSAVQHSPNQSSMDPGSTNENGTEPCVILVPEHELFTVEEKRSQLKKRRLTLLEACSKVTEHCRGGTSWVIQEARINDTNVAAGSVVVSGNKRCIR